MINNSHYDNCDVMRIPDFGDNNYHGYLNVH